MLANNEVMLRRVVGLSKSMRTVGTLPPRMRELVILHMARRHKCDFEWESHSRMSRGAGVDDADRNALEDADLGRFGGTELLALRFSEAVDEERVDDAIWDAIAAELDEGQMVELTVLAALYGMVARLVQAFGVDPQSTGA